MKSKIKRYWPPVLAFTMLAAVLSLLAYCVFNTDLVRDGVTDTVEYDVVIIEGCEYIKYDGAFGVNEYTHKGDCKNH